MLGNLWKRWRNRNRPMPNPHPFQPHPVPHPAPQPPPGPSPAPSSDINQAMLDSHNKIRVARGLDPLTKNDLLNSSAQTHAQTMAAAGRMEHDTLQDGKLGDRLHSLGYRYTAAGENIAMGQADVSSVTLAWQSDLPHLMNILGSYTEMGAAMVQDHSGRPYWCVDFGRPGVSMASPATIQWVTERSQKGNMSAICSQVTASSSISGGLYGTGESRIGGRSENFDGDL